MHVTFGIHIEYLNLVYSEYSEYIYIEYPALNDVLPLFLAVPSRDIPHYLYSLLFLEGTCYYYRYCHALTQSEGKFRPKGKVIARVCRI